MANIYKELEELLSQSNGKYVVFDEANKPKLIVLDPLKHPQFLVTDSGKPKILITGGAGYIGSHTTALLQKEGYECIVLDNLSTGFADSVSCKLIMGDMGDSNLLDKIFTENNISAVIHFAASIIVEESVKFPEKYFQNNLINTVNLVNSMVRNGVKRMVFSSSAAVYGNPLHIPVNENEPTNPTNPYGETKLLAEKILSWYSICHGLSSIALRYFNASGASLDGTLGEKKDVVSHLIPRVLRVAAKQDDSLQIYGYDYPTKDGTAVRDYVHVEDLARAHIMALQKLEKDAGHFVYNIGAGKGYTVAEVVEAVMEVTGKMVPIENAPRRAGDPAALVADAKKISKELGFITEHSDLPVIIKTAWDWHKSRSLNLK